MTDTSAQAADNPSVSCRPFLKWAGGKKKLLPELLSHVPANYKRYFEPFFGGGALFFALSPARAYLSDINPELINVYKVVRSNNASLCRQLEKHHYERSYFYKLRDIDRQPAFKRWGEVRRAARFIYLNKTCFNGLYRVNSKGQFNVPFGRYKNPKIFDRDHLRMCSARLQPAKLDCISFEQALARVRAKDFVYLDPPYVPLNASSSFTAYSKEGFGLDMQERLRDYCEALDRRGAYFLLSNSSASLVYDLYQDFDCHEVRVGRSINSAGNKRGKVTELLIKNY